MKIIAQFGIAVLVVSGWISNAQGNIEVAFEADPRLPIVYVNAAIKVGSASDPIGQFGLTHFMGEMLLRGTHSRTKEQIDLALDEMGASLEFETKSEFVVLRGSVLSSQLDSFLKLVQEVLTRPSFPEKEIKKLKSEVISSIEEELGHDSSLASRRFTKFLFQSHPYGKPVHGLIKDIQNLTRAKILSHYNRLVREDHLLIVGTGDASENKISAWAQMLAQDCPKKILSSEDQEILTVKETPQNYSGRRLLIVDKPDRTQTQIYAGQIGIMMTDKDYFPLYLANHAFGGGSFAATLMVEIRVKRGWSYGAYSSFRYGLQPRSWTLHLFPAEKDTAPALGYTLKLVEDLRTQGLTQEQFDFSKRSLINSAGFMYSTPKKRVENKLLERMLKLPEGFMESYATELQKVQLSETNKALQAFLKPNQLALTVLGTAQHLKDQLIKVSGLTEEQVEVVPYTEE